MWPESEVEKDAIRDLHISTTPDRVVAILGGTFVETRLERSIRGTFIQDERVLKELFHSSGPLGPFATKTRLAYSMGMMSKQTYTDLMCIKEIRNEFAHKIAAQSFDRQDIAQWCFNIKIVETHVHQRSGEPFIHTQDISLAIDDKAAMLAKPRERFLCAITLLTEYFSFPFNLGDTAAI